MIKPKLQFLLLFLTLVCLCGCMHYTTGTGSQVPFSTIYIYPVKNDSLVHHIRATLSSQVRQRIAAHPHIKVVDSPELADVCLEIKITDFSQSVATRMSDDSIHAKSFTLNIVTKCSLYNNRSQKYLFQDYVIAASIDSRAEGDYQWNKTKTMPQLSTKLADKIYDAVCKPW